MSWFSPKQDWVPVQTRIDEVTWQEHGSDWIVDFTCCYVYDGEYYSALGNRRFLTEGAAEEFGSRIADAPVIVKVNPRHPEQHKLDINQFL